MLRNFPVSGEFHGGVRLRAAPVRQHMPSHGAVAEARPPMVPNVRARYVRNRHVMAANPCRYTEAHAFFTRTCAARKSVSSWPRLPLDAHHEKVMHANWDETQTNTERQEQLAQGQTNMTRRNDPGVPTETQPTDVGHDVETADEKESRKRGVRYPNTAIVQTQILCTSRAARDICSLEFDCADTDEACTDARFNTTRWMMFCLRTDDADDSQSSRGIVRALQRLVDQQPLIPCVKYAE